MLKPSLRTFAVVFLAAATLGLGVIAWKQNRQLHQLRKQKDEQRSSERAQWERKLADAERRLRQLAEELATLKARGQEPLPGGPTPGEYSSNENADRAPRWRGRGPESFTALLNDPKFAKAMSNRDRMNLDARYASLFKSLVQQNGFTPQQLEAFKDLLVEKQNTLRDVMITARAQGITDRAAIGELIRNTQGEVDAQIQSTLGADAFAQYQDYEKTLPQRTLVNQLAQNLSYSGTPLTEAQSQQLIQTLADNAASAEKQGESAPGPGGPPPEAGIGGAPPGRHSVQISDTAVQQAQSFLTADQVQALAQLQAQQKEQEDLIKAVRASHQNAPGISPPASTPSPGTR